jgi:hypothetical protein
MSDIDFETIVQTELNKFNTLGIKKRLKNELIELYRQNAYINIEIIEDPAESFVEVTIILHDKSDVFTFSISRDYPFKPLQKILVNNKNYRSTFLKIESLKTLSEIKKNLKIDCLCCSSISCAANWTPSIRISYIIDEFYRFKQARRNIINKVLLKKILDRYLFLGNPEFDDYFYSFLIHF